MRIRRLRPVTPLQRVLRWPRGQWPAGALAALVLLATDACGWKPAPLVRYPSSPKVLVAHAGGAVDGIPYTNSRTAFDRSCARGFRLFEVDLLWTSDARVVLLHDWEDSFVRLFGAPKGRRSLADLRALHMRGDLGLLTMEDLADWLERHHDAFLVTDIKERNVETLALMARRWPELRHRVFPQIYQTEEYEPVCALGYLRILFTLYLSPATDDEVVRFAEDHELYGVTMWAARANNGRFVERLRATGVPVYAHTVNDWGRAETLLSRGVRGLYTDTLEPAELLLHVGRRPTIQTSPERRRRILALGVTPS